MKTKETTYIGNARDALLLEVSTIKGLHGLLQVCSSLELDETSLRISASPKAPSTGGH